MEDLFTEESKLNWQQEDVRAHVWGGQKPSSLSPTKCYSNFGEGTLGRLEKLQKNSLDSERMNVDACCILYSVQVSG